MKSFNKPTNEQLDAAIPLLSSPQHEAYFFARLENPQWIGPLRERGMFSQPLKAEQIAGGGVRFPFWPPSQYLARMAPHAATEVATIFAEIETDNAQIIGDMIRAAIAMPTDVAATLVPSVCRVAQAGFLWHHFHNASDLCARLVDSGAIDSAMMLAKDLFTPTFDEGREELHGGNEHWYKEGLTNVIPGLAGGIPREFLPVLCDWLVTSIQAKKHVNQETGADYSYSWRPAIEEHDQNSDYDFAGFMVGCVRHGFEQAIGRNKLSLSEALQMLNRFRYRVFRRMRMHLINQFAEQCPELVRQTIMDGTLFDDYEFKHEYAMLVGNRLGMLSRDEREVWFGWIDAAVEMSDYDELIKTIHGREVTQEEQDDAIRHWKFEKLHCVREYLDGERAEFYQQMLAKDGPPQLADLNVYSSGVVRVGHDSPMSVDDLIGSTFERAVAVVSSWKPDKPKFMGPDIEGLASTFRQYVATNPEAYSAQARVLIARPAIFIREFISEMAEASKAGRQIDALAVVDLCLWVVQRPLNERTTPQQEYEVQVDRDWQWTRDEISRFVRNVCTAKTDEVPTYRFESLREPIWQIINAVYRDRAKSNIVENIAEQDPRVHDYLDHGINSPRGKAVEAGLEYARWVTNHIKQVNGEQDVSPGGFDAMPEVRQMLEWQIASENRSVEALSLIGSHVGLINWIDRDWLAANADRLFDLQGIGASPPVAEGWSAWNAFLVWVRPHVEFYRLFKNQFAHAVHQSFHVQISDRSRQQPMHHLGEHLMILYGRGQLGLDDDGKLLTQFLANAHPDIRRHAVGFVGQSLKSNEPVPSEVLQRFMTMWDAYWLGPGKTDAEERPNAMLFGTWFSCGQFPSQWSLERLEEFVNVAPTPEPDHEIMERLAAIADVDIARSVRILVRMTRSDQEGWRIYGWKEAATQILQTAMSSDGEARTVAIEGINFLGRRGYTDFGNLLVGMRTIT